jgi:ankyrin repeat protein
LLERGADPLAIDQKGISVLHWACGRPGTGPAPSKVVAELLRRGADPLLKAGKSSSPYWITKGDTPSKLAEASGDRARKKLLAAAVAARAGSRSTSR